MAGPSRAAGRLRRHPGHVAVQGTESVIRTEQIRRAHRLRHLQQRRPLGVRRDPADGRGSADLASVGGIAPEAGHRATVRLDMDVRDRGPSSARHVRSPGSQDSNLPGAAGLPGPARVAPRGDQDGDAPLAWQGAVRDRVGGHAGAAPSTRDPHHRRLEHRSSREGGVPGTARPCRGGRTEHRPAPLPLPPRRASTAAPRGAGCPRSARRDHRSHDTGARSRCRHQLDHAVHRGCAVVLGGAARRTLQPRRSGRERKLALGRGARPRAVRRFRRRRGCSGSCRPRGRPADCPRDVREGGVPAPSGACRAAPARSPLPVRQRAGPQRERGRRQPLHPGHGRARRAARCGDTTREQAAGSARSRRTSDQATSCSSTRLGAAI